MKLKTSHICNTIRSIRRPKSDAAVPNAVKVGAMPIDKPDDCLALQPDIQVLEDRDHLFAGDIGVRPKINHDGKAVAFQLFQVQGFCSVEGEIGIWLDLLGDNWRLNNSRLFCFWAVLSIQQVS